MTVIQLTGGGKSVDPSEGWQPNADMVAFKKICEEDLVTDKVLQMIPNNQTTTEIEVPPGCECRTSDGRYYYNGTYTHRWDRTKDIPAKHYSHNLRWVIIYYNDKVYDFNLLSNVIYFVIDGLTWSNDVNHLTSLEYFDIINENQFANTNAYETFKGCYSLEAIPRGFNTRYCESLGDTFMYCNKLKYIPILDCYNVNEEGNTDYLFYNAASLEYVTILNIATSFDISDCVKLSRDVIVNNIFRHLGYGGGKTITLGSTLLNKLTAADKAIATKAQWTLR